MWTCALVYGTPSARDDVPHMPMTARFQIGSVRASLPESASTPPLPRPCRFPTTTKHGPFSVRRRDDHRLRCFGAAWGDRSQAAMQTQLGRMGRCGGV
eukprot:gene5320-18567_t